MEGEERMVTRRRMTSCTRLLINNHPLFRGPIQFPNFPATSPQNRKPPREAAVLWSSTGAALAAASVRRMAFPVWFEAKTLNEENVDASRSPVVSVTMSSGMRRLSEGIVWRKNGICGRWETESSGWQVPFGSSSGWQVGFVDVRVPTSE